MTAAPHLTAVPAWSEYSPAILPAAPLGRVRLRVRLANSVSDLGCRLYWLWLGCRLYWLWEDRRPGARLRRRLRAAEQKAASYERKAADYEAVLKALAESYSRHDAQDAS